MYVCPMQEGIRDIDTIIIRRGDDPGAYSSGTCFAIRHLEARNNNMELSEKQEAYAEALSRALAEGFILTKGGDYEVPKEYTK